MRVQSILLALLALSAARRAAAEEVPMSDYRVRGYMLYVGQQGAPSAACDATAIVACAAQGPWLLRASSTSLKIEGPSTGFAVRQSTIINCPEAVATITSDSSGNNKAADGEFPADAVSPALVPATAFTLAAGGNPNSLQLRTFGGGQPQCLFEFTLTEATSYILDVQPQKWVSWRSAALRGARAASPALLLVTAVAAAVAAYALL